MSKAQPKPKTDASAPTVDQAPKRGRQPHRRTPANERVVAAMTKAGATHPLIAEALGINPTTLYKYYADLISHPGPGRPEHQPTAASRAMVGQHKALGLKHSEIAALIGIERSALEKHYAEELLTGKVRVVGLVGSRVLTKALGNGPDALRAAEFYLTCQAKWAPRSKIGVDTGDDEAPLVEGQGRALTRTDARRVAFLLSRAALEPPRQAVVVPDEEPSR